MILQRLKQKNAEWRKVRVSMKKPWRDIVRANYHRSLDHRSFQFKTEEKKRLSSKSLIAELKEDHEKAFGMEKESQDSKAEPTGLEMLPASRKTRTLYTYCMTFPYDDMHVHRELYQLLEKCTDHLDVSERDNLLLFWRSFVEHLLDVKSNGDGDIMDESQTKAYADEPLPLNVGLDTWHEHEKVNPVRRHTRPSKLFFGNMSFYVFFRLHQVLHTY